MNEFLQSFSSLPNAHPGVVHFPISLLITAFGFDLACLFLRSQTWLDRAAAALYGLGALAAGATYLTGRQAADTVGQVTPAADLLMSRHSDWAFYTLLFFSGFALVRIGLAWRERVQTEIGARPLRILLLLAALGGQGLVFGTADRGGALVYHHGVGVNRPDAGPLQDADSNPARATSFSTEEDGTFIWHPQPDEFGALGTILTFVDENSRGIVIPIDSQPGTSGLSLEVAGRAMLVFSGIYDDVQVEAELDIGGFSGTVGLAHHVRQSGTARLFEVTTDGEAALTAIQEDGRQVLNESSFESTGRLVTLTVSTMGSHLKGYGNGQLLVHGHGPSPPPGKIGLLLDGMGIVRILAVQANPIQNE